MKFVDRSRFGIEIGPSHNPIAPKSSGYNVHIIDHCSQADLRAKYKAHGVNIDAIEPVDFIWSGQDYCQLTGKEHFYGWIIASHVIEHTPDLISFINQCDSVMAEDGILSLVIPDKRYCFDHFRGTTNLAQVIDAHFESRKRHSAGAAVEYYLNVVKRGGNIAWGQGIEGEYSFVHGLSDAKAAIDRIRLANAFIDLHGWCFTPTSFRLLIQDLNDLGFIKMKELYSSPTEGCEFYVTLSSKGSAQTCSRLNLVSRALAELSEGL